MLGSAMPMASMRRRTVSSAWLTAELRFSASGLEHLQVDDAAGLVLGVDPLHVREGDAEDIILGGGDLGRVGELDVEAVEADPLGVDVDVLLLLEGRLELAGDLVELVLEGLVDGDRVLEVEAALEVEAELEAALEGVGDPGGNSLSVPRICAIEGTTMSTLRMTSVSSSRALVLRKRRMGFSSVLRCHRPRRRPSRSPRAAPTCRRSRP
jgi:hypothetical protein